MKLDPRTRAAADTPSLARRRVAKHVEQITGSNLVLGGKMFCSPVQNLITITDPLRQRIAK